MSVECGFFRATGGAGGAGGRKGEQPIEWAGALHRLVRSGHCLPEVKNYTLAQLEAFLAAEAQAERERLADRLVITAVATQDDRCAIERLQRELIRAN